MTTDFSKLIHKISSTEQQDSKPIHTDLIQQINQLSVLNTNLQIQIDQLNAKLTEHIDQYNTDIQSLVDIIDQIHNDR